MNSPSNDADNEPDTFIQDCLSDLTSKRTGPKAEKLGAENPPAGSVERSESLPSDAAPKTATGGPEPQADAEAFHEMARLSAPPPQSISLPALTEPSNELSVTNLERANRVPSASRGGKNADVHPLHLATSTFLSLVMVLALLLVARLIVPSLVESIRYGWYRGQLRAEYELSGERLRSVSLDSLADVSQLVSQRAGPSVVHINLLSDQKTLEDFESLLGPPKPSSKHKYQGQGSGFIIDSAGYVLTNNHVVDDMGLIEVSLSDGRKLPAEIVGSDPLTDLAVLRIDADNLMAVDWGDSDAVVVGTPVWAVGSPFGLQQTVTFGIISGKHRVDFSGTREADTVKNGTAYSDLMQSDVALNPGNSGGPLVNSLGQVVGVNAAILGETFRGVSFSIPSRVAKQVASHLISMGEVSRGWLGVRLEDPLEEDRFGEDGVPRAGVRVSGFPEQLSSPAKVAGICIDDQILAFEGLEVNSRADLIRMIGESPVGKTVTLVVQRKAEKLSIAVTLDRRAKEIDLPSVVR